MHHTIRAFLIASLVLGVSAIILNAAVDNPYFHRILGQAINEQVEDKTHAKLDFKAISLQFVPPGFDIYGVSLKGQEDQEILSCSRLQVRISILSLLLGRPKLGLLQFSELRASFPLPHDIMKPNKKTKKVDKGKFKGIEWPPQVNIPIDTLALTDSTIDFRIPADDGSSLLATRLDGLNFELDYSDWDDWSSEIDITRLNLFAGGAHLIKDAKFEMGLKNDDNRVYSQDLSLKSNRLHLIGDATLDLNLVKQKMDLFRDRRLVNFDLTGLSIYSDLKLLSGDIAILGDYLGTDNTAGDLKGAIKFSAQIPIAEGSTEWSLGGTVSSNNATLDGFKLLQSDLDFSIDENFIYFDQFQVRENRKDKRAIAQGKGKLSFSKGTAFDFSVQPSSLSFTTLMKMLQVDDYGALEAKLSSPSLKIWGSGSPFKMDVEGPLLFKDLTLPQLEDSPYATTSCDFDAKFQISSSNVEIKNNLGSCIPPKVTESQEEDINQDLDTSFPLILDGKVFFSTKEGINLRVTSPEMPGSSLAHFVGQDITGDWNIKSKVHGPYSDLRVSAEVSGIENTFMGFPSASTSGKLSYVVNKNSLEIESLTLNEAEQGHFKIPKGELSLSPLNFSGRIQAKNLSHKFIEAGLKELFPEQDVSFGIKSLTGHIDVPINKPLQWKGKLQSAISNGKKDGQKFFSLAKGTVEANSKQVKADDLYLRLDLLEANLSYLETRVPSSNLGNSDWENLGLNLDNKVSIQVNTVGNNLAGQSIHKTFDKLNHLASIPMIGPKLSALKIGSDVQFETKLEGSFRHLRGSFSGTLERMVAFGSPIAPIQFSGFADGSKIDIPMLKHAGNSFVGRLNFDFLEPGIPYQWYFYLDQFDARAVFSPFFAKDPRNFAYVSADWTMKGNFDTWWDSNGSLNINKIESQFVQKSDNQLQKIQLKAEDAILLSLNKNSWQFKDKKSLSLKGNEFELEVTLDGNNPPDDLNIETKGLIDLSIVRKLVPAIETARGKILFNGYIRGSLEDPDVNIQFTDQKLDPLLRKTWKPITIGFIDFAPAFTNVSINGVLTNKSIIINDVSGNKGARGNFKVKGNWSLVSERPEDSQIFINFSDAELQRFYVPIFKSADATLSGDITVTGSKKPFLVSGNISVVEASSQTDFDLRKQIVSSIQQSKFAAPTAQNAPIFNFDLSLNSDSKILIKNKNMDVTLSSDISLRGNEQKPIILGQIESSEGTFNYRRDFQIQRGIVSFEEPTYPPDPRLDVIGESEILTEGTNYIVQVIVSGKASDPKVTLTVDPPTKPDGTAFSKIDIILLMTTGRLPSSDSNTPNVLENEALSLFVGYAEGPLEKIFDLTGQQYIRQIYIDTYLPNADDSQPVARLNLPVRITDDLSLILQLDYAENMKASFQYSLHQKITVSGSLDKRNEEVTTKDSNLPADTAADLKFKFNFE